MNVQRRYPNIFSLISFPFRLPKIAPKFSVRLARLANICHHSSIILLSRIITTLDEASIQLHWLNLLWPLRSWLINIAIHIPNYVSLSL